MRFQDLRELYRLQVDTHEHDSARFWAIFSLMSVINGGLIAIVVSTKPDWFVEYLLAGFGFVVCAAWFMMQRRFAYWVKCYKLRRYVASTYYFRAVLETHKDDDDIQIEDLDKRTLATQYFTRHQLKASSQAARKPLPRYYHEYPACHENPTGEEQAPEKLPSRNEKIPGWGSMRMGALMPVFFGVLWAAVGLHQWVSDIRNATSSQPEARILKVRYKPDAITITLEVPRNEAATAASEK